MMHEGKLINQNPLDEIFDKFYRGEIGEPELTFNVVTASPVSQRRKDAALMDLVSEVYELQELQYGCE